MNLDICYLIPKVFGLHRETVSKMLRYSAPPGYRRSEPVRRPKLDVFTGVIDRILAEDRSAPRKQRHTAKRIFERLRDEHGFEGGYTIVKDYVRERRLRSREVFVHGACRDLPDVGRLAIFASFHERRGFQFLWNSLRIRCNGIPKSNDLGWRYRCNKAVSAKIFNQTIDRCSPISLGPRPNLCIGKIEAQGIRH